MRVNDIPPYVLPGPSLVFPTLVQDWPILSESLLVTLMTTLEGFLAAAIGGIALALLFNRSHMAGIFAVSLRGHPAGDAGGRDRAVAADLSAATDGGGRLRLDRRLLSGAGEHHARAEFGRPQSGRAVRALWRVARADAVAAEIAVGIAAYSRRLAHRRRTVADRRRGRRNRRGLGGRRLRPCLTGLPNPATGSIFPACSPLCCCSPSPGLSSYGPARWFRILCYGAGTKARLERKADGCREYSIVRKARCSGVWANPGRSSKTAFPNGLCCTSARASAISAG